MSWPPRRRSGRALPGSAERVLAPADLPHQALLAQAVERRRDDGVRPLRVAQQVGAALGAEALDDRDQVPARSEPRAVESTFRIIS